MTWDLLLTMLGQSGANTALLECLDSGVPVLIITQFFSCSVIELSVIRNEQPPIS